MPKNAYACHHAHVYGRLIGKDKHKLAVGVYLGVLDAYAVRTVSAVAYGEVILGTVAERDRIRICVIVRAR